MPLVKVYSERTREVFESGVKMIKRGWFPVCGMYLVGRAVRARGTRKNDTDYGVFELTGQEIEVAKANGLKVVGA